MDYGRIPKLPSIVVSFIRLILSNSAKFKDKVIFKGGTALSKAFQIIDRFSEDVDLAIITEGMSNNQIQKLIKAVEKEKTVDVEETTIERITSKGSKVHEYTRKQKSNYLIIK